MTDTPSTWTVEHLRSAERLARDDAARMADLDRWLARDRVRGRGVKETCGCGAKLTAQNSCGLCYACRHRKWMAEHRRSRSRAQMDRHNELRRLRRRRDRFEVAP